MQVVSGSYACMHLDTETKRGLEMVTEGREVREQTANWQNGPTENSRNQSENVSRTFVPLK